VAAALLKDSVNKAAKNVQENDNNEGGVGDVYLRPGSFISATNATDF